MANKKKYTINWEDGEAVSFEVDGVTYESLDQIPDDKDMRKMLALMNAAEDEELEAELALKPGQMQPEKIVLGIFSGVAILMLLIAGISSFNAVSQMAKEKSAPGRVVEMVIKRSYVNEEDRIIQEYAYPVVEFSAADGKRRSVQLSEGSDPPAYEKGDEVTVLYDPQHPLDARIKSFGSSALMWILPGITGTLGLAFLGAVLLVRKLIGPETPVKAVDPLRR